MRRTRSVTEWRLQEYESKVLPGLSREQALQIRELFGNYVEVGRDLLSGHYELRAGHHVGVLVMDGLRIVIEPKTPVGNLFEMLTYAYDLPQFRREEAPLTESAALFPFIIRIFVRQVGRLLRQGIYRHYVDIEENQSLLRGRLLLDQQLQRNAVRADRFYQQLNEHTADVLENRILKYTLWQLSRLATLDESLRRQLRRALSGFADVSLVRVSSTDCLDVLYTRLNSRYRTPVNLAHLLLEHLSLEARVGGVAAASFVFNMNEVFERFVAYYLREHVPALDDSLQIEIQPNIWLDMERKEKARPDIVLRKDGTRHVILDTKYKVFEGSPSGADLHQMMAYCHSMQLGEAILIYPGAERINYRRRFQNFTVQALNVNLGGELEAFREECLRLAGRVVGVM